MPARYNVIARRNPDGVWDLQDGAKKPMVSKLKVMQGMRLGVVTFALGFGHWASGAREISINKLVVGAAEPFRRFSRFNPR